LLDNALPQDNAMANASDAGQELSAPQGAEADTEPRAPRERRGRDRYGRDRRERGPRDETTGGTDAAAVEVAEAAPLPRTDGNADEAPVRSSYFTRDNAAAPVVNAPAEPQGDAAAPLSEVNEPAPERAARPAVVPAEAAPRAAAVPVAREAVPAPAPQGLPVVQPFVLPIEEMNRVAQTSGLEWVNSNAEKVAQVQAAIAAEPRSIHVPREPRPVVVVDEGPLVLVETRKDLRSTSLPFETPTGG
jgi:ribonuclease E